jgi:type IV pilus assembly protein PilF
MKSIRPTFKRVSLITVLFAMLAFGSAGCSSSTRGTKEVSDAERVQMLVELASANLIEGDATHALVSLTNAESIDHKNPTVFYLFSLAYFQKHEPELAISAARKAIQLKPDYSQAKNTLGKLLLDQGKYSEAEKYLTEAAQDLMSDDAYLAKTNLGILYYKRLDYDRAEHWLDRAISDGRDSSCMASYYRGLIYSARNELPKALNDFTSASRNQCSQFADGHLAVAKTELRLKKYEVARAKFLEVQQIFPNSDAADKANLYLKEIP